MILTEEQIPKAKLAGHIAGKALHYGASLIKEDAVMVEVLDKIEAYILQNGGQIAFPAQIAMNDVAAHFCPLADDTTVFKASDIIKLDVGVHVEGFIGDNARTIIFKNNPRYDEYFPIVKASEEALANALNIIKTDVTLGEIGLMIQETIAKYDLSPIRNLSGHGLGQYKVHTTPTVPNINTNDKTVLQENQHIAIEPFATNGQGLIFESVNPTLFSIAKPLPVRSVYARELLRDVAQYGGLPFTTRWLTKKHGLAKIRLAMHELRQTGMLGEYAPLIEMKHGLVSQSEHTVIVREKPIITTKIDD